MTTHPTDASNKKRRLGKSQDSERNPKKLKCSNDTGRSQKDLKGKGKASGEFTVVKASLILSIAPIFANNPKLGVEEMLDSLLMRYIPALRGVVLAHSNTTFSSPTGTLIAECPFMVCNVGFDATVWSPQVGTKLVGKVNLCSPDHISLLVHRTFNASIPRYHIPTDHWEFEYGPAENDPEFGPDATAIDGEDALADDVATERTADPEKNGGRWIHKVTGDQLGGKEGLLEFTIIGLTIANEMLSLLGSIQDDPFSSEHVPHPVLHIGESSGRHSPEIDRDEDQRAYRSVSEGAGSDEDDPFAALGRKADEVAARRKHEEATKKEKAKDKRKRKSEAVEEVTTRVDKGEKKTKRIKT